jgi:ethanolamine utilization microcompartment shell protein EutL
MVFPNYGIHNLIVARGKVIHICGGPESSSLKSLFSADMNNFETGISCVWEVGASSVNND